MERFSLDGLQMNVIQTAAGGVVNQDTIFVFTQDRGLVTAYYQGGAITKGFLVGDLNGNRLNFAFCQLQKDGRLDNGNSVCELYRADNGKLSIRENFEWQSRKGQYGTNIFQEI